MITCKDIIKIFQDIEKDHKVAALRGLDISVDKGDLVSVIGPSGAGKTTLIKILAGIELPTSGIITVKGNRLDKMSEHERREFRCHNIGLVNQYVSENLLSHLTVKQNLLMQKRALFTPKDQAQKHVKELASLLNLEHILENKARKISGGEAIRLSIGVALAKNADILLLDEPTGQLDTKNTENIIETLRQVNLAFEKTIVVVTHDIRFRTFFDKSFIIRDGRLVGISRDIERDELEFLMHSSEIKRTYVDASNFVRIPAEVKIATAIGEKIEFDTHPSKKLGLFWNPDIVTREKIYEIITKPLKKTDEAIEKITYEDVEPLISREFIPPKKQRTIISLEDIKKGFHSASGYNEVITNLSLELHEEDFVFISGPSGVGKTTLLNIIAGLLKPEKGDVTACGIRFTEENDSITSQFRLDNIAYIAQHNNLFNPINIRDNLLLPYIFSSRKFDKKYGSSISKECYIDHKFDSHPFELSEGEKQRAALAVALSRKTKIILADEPTANLDTELARSIMDLLMDIVRINKTTMIVCSHDLTLLRPGFRHIELLDGRIEKDGRITKKSLEKIVKDYLLIKETID